MRSLLLCCICLLALTSCVNYYGEKSHSTPLCPTNLSTQQTYKIPHTRDARVAAQGWWQKFHDPQLNQLITVALADSPTMQSAEYRVRKAQELVARAGAALWPSVDASGYMQRQRFSQFGLVPPPFNGQTFNIGEVGLNFNYDFDFWGKNRELVAANVNEACAAEADRMEANLVLSSAVANTYFQLESQTEQWKMADKIAQYQQQISQIIQDRAQHGVESDIPVTTATSDYAAAKLTALQYQAAAKLSLDQLAVLMGKNPAETHIEIDALSNHQYHVSVPSYLPAHLLAQRPDIRASLYRVQAAAHKINVAKARFFPDINLSALLSYQSINYGKLFNPNAQNNAITGAIDLPIFDAGARRADLGVGYAEYDIAVSDYNQNILVALREVTDQLAIIKSVHSELSTQNKSLRAAKKKFNLTESRYKHGIIDYVQVLENKTDLLQQQETQINLQSRHLQAIVAMTKALGGMS